jgi:hypothetical protein
MDRARPEIHEKGGVMASYNHYPPRQYRALNVWLVLLVLALVGMLAWKFWPFSLNSGLDPDAQPRPVVARGDLSELEKTTIAVFRQNSPSVKGTGSGFIWDENHPGRRRGARHARRPNQFQGPVGGVIPG